MYVAACNLSLRLPGNRSLKEKRQTLRSLIDRVRHRFKVSIAEVGDQERHQAAVLGVAAVSGDAALAARMIERVVDYAESHLHDAQIVSVESDVAEFP